MKTRVYRLVPAIPSDDPGWDRAFNQGEVIVRARSSGEARAIAARAEAAHAGEPVRATTQVVASALSEPRLYTVRLDSSGRFTDDGPVQVLSGTFRFPDGVVMHGD